MYVTLEQKVKLAVKYMKQYHLETKRITTPKCSEEIWGGPETRDKK